MGHDGSRSRRISCTRSWQSPHGGTWPQDDKPLPVQDPDVGGVVDARLIGHDVNVCIQSGTGFYLRSAEPVGPSASTQDFSGLCSLGGLPVNGVWTGVTLPVEGETSF